MADPNQPDHVHGGTSATAANNENNSDLSSFEGDGLPDLNNESSDYDVFNVSDNAPWGDHDTTITISNSESDIVKNDTPLYQNQEQDPDVQEILFQELMNSFE